MSHAPLTQDQVFRTEGAQKFMKAHGIVTIVIGALLALAGLAFMLLFGWVSLSERAQGDAIAAFVAGIIFFVLVFLPGVYLAWSGIVLRSLPSAAVAKTLTIINLVLSVLAQNYILVVLTIIGLTQLRDYELKDQLPLK